MARLTLELSSSTAGRTFKRREISRRKREILNFNWNVQFRSLDSTSELHRNRIHSGFYEILSAPRGFEGIQAKSFRVFVNFATNSSNNPIRRNFLSALTSCSLEGSSTPCPEPAASSGLPKGRDAATKEGKTNKFNNILLGKVEIELQCTRCA